MGIKKVVRPMNKAKNAFVKWLKDNNADNIDGLKDQPSDNEWDYYMVISGFINNNLYSVSFMVWQGKESIQYSDEENQYDKMSIDEFMQLVN
tara:strand:+ start:2854 stop:3129 length:276 start_codon:yes stop_codon:yes gene_type:complete